MTVTDPQQQADLDAQAQADRAAQAQADPAADPAATDIGAATEASLRSRFKAAVAPVERMLDGLEAAQHAEGQAVQVEDAARKAMTEAAATRETKTEATVSAKSEVTAALGGLDTFVRGLRAELSS